MGKRWDPRRAHLRDPKHFLDLKVTFSPPSSKGLASLLQEREVRSRERKRIVGRISPQRSGGTDLG